MPGDSGQQRIMESCPEKPCTYPHIDCLMVKELKQGALKQIKGILEYDFYRALT